MPAEPAGEWPMDRLREWSEEELRGVYASVADLDAQKRLIQAGSRHVDIIAALYAITRELARRWAQEGRA